MSVLKEIKNEKVLSRGGRRSGRPQRLQVRKGGKDKREEGSEGGRGGTPLIPLPEPRDGFPDGDHEGHHGRPAEEPEGPPVDAEADGRERDAHAALDRAGALPDADNEPQEEDDDDRPSLSHLSEPSEGVPPLALLLALLRLLLPLLFGRISGLLSGLVGREFSPEGVVAIPAGLPVIRVLGLGGGGGRRATDHSQAEDQEAQGGQQELRHNGSPDACRRHGSM